MRSNAVVVSLALVCLAGAALRPEAAGAADSATEARLREALRTTVGQLRALEDERSAWKAKEAELHQKLEALQKELAIASKQAPTRTNDRALAQASRNLDERSEELARTKAALEQCMAGSRKALESDRAKDDERTKLAEAVKVQTERADGCETKNGQLFTLANEAMDRLVQTGGDVVFGFGQVKRENLAQDLKDRLLEQRVKP
jgi:chromosome segregation ATPase